MVECRDPGFQERGLRPVRRVANEGGQGIPAAFLRSLRGLLGREASTRQQARIVDLQRQFDLAPGDSIFVVVAILEAYLQQVEMACVGVRRSTRRTLSTACFVAVVCSTLLISPLYLMNPDVRVAMGWSPKPANAAPHETPLRAYLHATLDQLSDEEVARVASSQDAISIVLDLPHATDGQLASIDRYLKQPTPMNGR